MCIRDSINAEYGGRTSAWRVLLANKTLLSGSTRPAPRASRAASRSAGFRSTTTEGTCCSTCSSTTPRRACPTQSCCGGAASAGFLCEAVCEMESPDGQDPDLEPVRAWKAMMLLWKAGHSRALDRLVPVMLRWRPGGPVASKVLIVENILSADLEALATDEYDDIVADFKEECRKYGTVVALAIPASGRRGCSGLRKGYILFDQILSAQKVHAPVGLRVV
eukprot:TRINITY_DN3261_c0_g5_i1.p1 TRINITY_DN3261_c0_g5~~TRINITY_DN3261_c0_g5_i1.p1  ORF type:complete len:221 (+),score=44.66 TRINITY_DN3261_c0_g5_i1:142-804(+)